MLLDLIVGARPNFIKIAPLIQSLEDSEDVFTYRLIHTGQHYDTAMSEQFFRQLNIPNPDVNFNAGGGTQAQQTGAIMCAYESLLSDKKPDLTIVVGDVTSTLACTIVAKKAGVKVAHIEAGIRSGDLQMPEEINRIVTDSICDLFFTTTPQAGQLLKGHGIDNERIHYVGNIMIDTLRAQENHFFAPDFWESQQLVKDNYIVLTLHRPSNVDDQQRLKSLLSQIATSTRGHKKVVLPVHPRAQHVMQQLMAQDDHFAHFIRVQPLSYLEFNYLVKNAAGVITDSGGITEEATVMHIPCITLRTSTERPETVTIGTNVLAGIDLPEIDRYLHKMIQGQWKKGGIPELWDGHTAARIVQVIKELKSKKK